VGWFRPQSLSRPQVLVNVRFAGSEMKWNWQCRVWDAELIIHGTCNVQRHLIASLNETDQASVRAFSCVSVTVWMCVILRCCMIYVYIKKENFWKLCKLQVWFPEEEVLWWSNKEDLPARHVVPMDTKFWCRNLKKWDHVADLGVDWRIILKWMMRK
jgi:hypothetical protein